MFTDDDYLDQRAEQRALRSAIRPRPPSNHPLCRWCNRRLDMNSVDEVGETYCLKCRTKWYDDGLRSKVIRRLKAAVDWLHPPPGN